MGIAAEFTFYDLKFNTHDYEYCVELPVVPRVGEEVWLPDLDGGGPLRHEGTNWYTEIATVSSVEWHLEDDDHDHTRVSVYCDMEWAEQ